MPRPLLCLARHSTPVPPPAVGPLLPGPRPQFPAHSERPSRRPRTGHTRLRPHGFAHSARTLSGSLSPAGHAHLLAPPLANATPTPDANSHGSPAPSSPTHASLLLLPRPRPLHLGGAGAGSGCRCWRRWLRGGGRGRVQAAATSWADPGARGVTRGECRGEGASPPAGSRVRCDRLGWGPHEAGSLAPSGAAGSWRFPAPRWLRERRRGGRGAQPGASEGAIW